MFSIHLRLANCVHCGNAESSTCRGTEEAKPHHRASRIDMDLALVLDSVGSRACDNKDESHTDLQATRAIV